MKKFISTLAIVAITIASCKKNKNETPKQIPLVTTAALINTGNGNYTAGGSIVSDGGATVTQSGIVWSKINATPTLTDTVVAGTTATGAFTTSISGINFNTTYYFRAFATNSVGTGYGSVVTLTTSSDSVRFTYNGQSVTYGIIVSPTTGKKWLDRNLGAQRVATSMDDYQAYGDLFQWGRPADGHQLINWTSSTAGSAVNGNVVGVTASSDIPGHSNFIIPPYALPLDWRDNNNSNRWVTTPQGPCPSGWHVPTVTEWLAETSTTSGGTANSGGMTGNINGYNLLKLVVAGGRNLDASGVNFTTIGVYSKYWSSSDAISGSVTKAGRIKISSPPGGVDLSFEFKGNAMSVRCIKD